MIVWNKDRFCTVDKKTCLIFFNHVWSWGLINNFKWALTSYKPELLQLIRNFQSARNFLMWKLSSPWFVHTVNDQILWINTLMKIHQPAYFELSALREVTSSFQVGWKDSIFVFRNMSHFLRINTIRSYITHVYILLELLARHTAHQAYIGMKETGTKEFIRFQRSLWLWFATL